MPATTLHDLGIICSLGIDKEQVLTNLSTKNNQEYLTLDTDLLLDGASLFVGRVNHPLPCLANEGSYFQSRNNQLAQYALTQILPCFDTLKAQFNQPRIAVVIGTSTSGILEGEQARKTLLETGNLPESFHYSAQEMYAPAQFIAKKVQANGPVYSVSTACSSSAKALASGKMLIESDIADIVICGGVDTLSQLPINGFKALESTAKKYCNPFGEHRDGINIGEGAALFVMSACAGNIQLTSAGESSDAYHISAPQPEGVGAQASMTQALNYADIQAEQLSYLNLHGTGTPKNDEMEAQAVFNLCGDSVLASSTKRLTGHALGAAGAIEAGLCWLVLNSKTRDYLIPENKNNGTVDPTIAPLNLSAGQQVENMSFCLSNSFAFGGSNISLILGKSFE